MNRQKKSARTLKNQGLPWRNHQKKTIVVLITFNDALNLRRMLELIDEALWEKNLPYLIVVIDDGSSDDTISVLENYSSLLPLHYISHENHLGFGLSLRQGLKYASSISVNGDAVVVMDTRFQHNPFLIPRMIQSLREGNDVVIASRFEVLGWAPRISWKSKILLFLENFLSFLFAPIPGVKDYSSPFRAYSSKVLRMAFDKHGNNWLSSYDTETNLELLINLHHMGATVGEVPWIIHKDSVPELPLIFKSFEALKRRITTLFQYRRDKID